MATSTLLVTGASSDIGLALLRDLADPSRVPTSMPGRIIAHANRGGARLEALAAELPALAGRLSIVRADLSVPAEADRFVAEVREAGVQPTQIVHLAASRLKLGRTAKLSWPDLQADLEVQLHSLVKLVAAFCPAMARGPDRAKIVVMLSSITLPGASPRYMSEYVVAKHALLGYFRALCAEYADKPICINAVSPSMVETQFLAGLPPLLVEQAAAASPGKRNAVPADIVPAIRFLLSAEADYISGVNLPVTAGSVA